MTGLRPPGLALVARTGPAPVAWHGSRLISAEEFLSHAGGVAQRLPAGAAVINLCENRYLFLVAFAAALLKGLPTLLPSSLPEGLSPDLHARYPGSILCSDRAIPEANAPVFRVELGAHAPAENPALDGDSLAAILFTSGSTGTPVAQAKTWNMLCAGARMNSPYYLGDAPRSWSVVATVPAQHMYGMETSIMPALQGAVTFHDGRPFFPADVVQALEVMPEPRLLVSSPLHLRALARSGLSFPAIARVLCATAPLDCALAQEIEQALGAELIEIFGSTEAGSMAWRHAAADSPWRFFAGFTACGAANRVHVHAPHLPEQVPLSDILEFAPDGDFRLAGRVGDMVKIAGKRTSLAAITRCLANIPGVDDALAFCPDPAPGRDAGESRIAALVVAPSVELKDIRAALRARLDPVFVPREIHRVPALPRNATGKITRRELVQLLAGLGNSGAAT